MTNDYVTRDELAGLVDRLDHRLESVDMHLAAFNQRADRFERSLNRFFYVFGGLLALVFATEVLILARVGL